MIFSSLVCPSIQISTTVKDAGSSVVSSTMDSGEGKKSKIKKEAESLGECLTEVEPVTGVGEFLTGIELVTGVGESLTNTELVPGVGESLLTHNF